MKFPQVVLVISDNTFPRPDPQSGEIDNEEVLVVAAILGDLAAFKRLRLSWLTVSF